MSASFPAFSFFTASELPQSSTHRDLACTPTLSSLSLRPLHLLQQSDQLRLVDFLPDLTLLGHLDDEVRDPLGLLRFHEGDA